MDSPSPLSQSPNRSQWTRLFCRHTPYERFDPGHRHGVRYRFGGDVATGLSQSRETIGFAGHDEIGGGDEVERQARDASRRRG